uniref:Uncharacterized protein n=1 Tax=Ficedula albicollis TaxID=59894 RepID=A0A803WA14_FICAL
MCPSLRAVTLLVLGTAGQGWLRAHSPCIPRDRSPKAFPWGKSLMFAPDKALSATFSRVCSEPVAIGQPGPQDKAQAVLAQHRGQSTARGQHGEQRGHRGAPAAPGPEQLSGLRGVWLPASRPSGRSWLCLPTFVPQQENRGADRAASSLQPLDGACPAAAPADLQPPAPLTGAPGTQLSVLPQGSLRPWAGTAASVEPAKAARVCAEAGLTPGDSKASAPAQKQLLQQVRALTASKGWSRAPPGATGTTSHPGHQLQGLTGTSCSHGHPSSRRRDSLVGKIPGITVPAHKAVTVQQEQILQGGWEGRFKGRAEALGGFPPCGAAPWAQGLGIAGSAPCSQGFPWQMPQLGTQHLQGHEELHLAHLVLSFITMGYVWQEGEEGTVQVLPRNLAVPYWEVSQALGLPPVLSHADFVLANWRRKDPNG